MVGTILMRSAGCCVNDVADRDFDRHVKRTAQRPVTTGAISVTQALGIRCGAGAGGLRAGADDQPADHPAVVRGAGGDAGLPAMPSASCRCRRRCWAWPSASASRWPLPPCWAAATGGWQAVADAVPPHGLGAAGRQPVLGAGLRHRIRDGRPRRRPADRHEDLGHHAGALGRAGGDGLLRRLPGGLGAASAAGSAWARWYLLGLAAGGAQALWHFTLIRARTREGCFRAFRANHWVGFAVFAGVVVDLALR